MLEYGDDGKAAYGNMMNSYGKMLPTPAHMAVERLEAAGYEAFLVGGCMRDIIMGNSPHDIDITTSAYPEQTILVFSGFRVVETGIKHGTVAVIIEGLPIEITTYRIDGSYTDGRRPDAVKFSKSLEADLSRRDFTINSIAFNPHNNRLVDMFGGVDDIKKRIIRTVGDPCIRFEEDGLRIFRGLRFASVLDFKLEENTYSAMLEKKLCLKNVSKERIAAELKKLIAGKAAANILPFCFELFQTIFTNIFGEYTRLEWENRVKTVGRMPQNPDIRFAALLNLERRSTAQKLEIASDFCRCLKFDNASKSGIISLLASYDMPLSEDEICIRRLLSKLGTDCFFNMISLKRAEDIASKNSACFDAIIITAKRILESGFCLSIAQLAVNGRHLQAWGINEGKEIGEALSDLLLAVIEGEVQNNETALFEYWKRRQNI